MGNIGEPFTDSVPAVGTSGTAYATSVNAILDEVILRLEALVPVGSIAPAEDPLDMNNQAVQNASYLGLYTQSSAPSGSPFGRLARYAGNLYYVDSSGAVQITDGAGLAASGSNGIGGDYGGVNPALVDFDDGTETYQFYDDGTLLQWAILKAKSAVLVDEASGRTITVSPSPSIAASYNFTLPPNDPASGVSLLTLSDTGAVRLAESAAVTNAFTMNADLTLAAGRRLLHDGRSEVTPATNGVLTSGSVLVGVQGTQASGGAATLYFPLTLERQSGWRVTAVFARLTKTTGGTARVQLARYADGAETLIGVEATSTGTGALTLSQGSLTESPYSAGTTAYFVKVTVPANTDYIHYVGFTYEVV